MTAPPRPPGSKVLILGRFSSDMQNLLSADDQIKLCVAKCEQLGWIVKGTFKDEAKSGRSVVKRAGYLEMMATAEAEAVNVIVAVSVSLDRIGRNARELRDARDRLTDVNAVIYTLDRGVMSQLEFAILAVTAEMESEKIGQRSLRGRRAAAARGKFIGDIPYGFRAIPGPDGRTVEKDPVTSPILLRVNEDYAAGISPGKIAANLIREGIPTPRGVKVWSATTILGTKGDMIGLLQNPMNIGKVCYEKTKETYNRKTGKYVRRRGNVDEMQVFDAPWLRVISDELWQKVQDRIAERTFTTLRESRHPDYLLTGLVKCAVCGGSYTMTSAKLGCTNRWVQACDNSRRVVREDLESVVLEGLRGRIAQAHVIEWFLPEYVQETERAAKEGSDKDTIRQARREQVGCEIENLLRQMKAGATGFAAKLINDELEALGREQEQLDRELHARRPAPAPTGATPEAVVERLHALFDDLGAALNGEERDATRARDIVRSFITKVVITPMDSDGRQDRRGCGPVRVTVEGAISTLVDEALLDRKIMHRPSLRLCMIFRSPRSATTSTWTGIFPRRRKGF